ncbi:nitrous oxide reductase accessory protein NosL [Halobellus inordinatus]|jgi:nitrous oxide reductase accessory protein NosL|uniref:nitrous oxide reductase accessory protein NosL n=1 Tax=Halobellus inordinatus TaxID=1126236 RepID=UPI00210C3F6C|nr:nitrous oxide reductase accessory protein NosL [Halobellus inordinatus]
MSDSHDNDGLTRRRALGAGGAVLTLALAGCSGTGDGGTTETETATTTQTDTATPTAEPTTTETGEASLSALEVPEDANCAVCNMKPAKFPDYNAQLQYESAEPKFFCSNGCMASFAADPGHFEEAYADASIAAAFVHDHDTTDWIDGLAASYVLEMDSERVDDPMRINPLAFDTEADATAYVEQYDDLTAEDVVGFDAFDRDLAEQYRASFFE